MKRSNLLLLYVFAIAAVLEGCATQEGVRPKWTLQARDFVPIMAGNTNKADVERLVGKPIMTMVFRNLGEETWDYRYLDGTMTYVAEVHFDLQGKTKYYATYPDQCQFAPTGCR
jgi:outer membrane protein assembly factor BamE (lipoprotein component of BamABCDE complex)